MLLIVVLAILGICCLDKAQRAGANRRGSTIHRLELPCSNQYAERAGSRSLFGSGREIPVSTMSKISLQNRRSDKMSKAPSIEALARDLYSGDFRNGVPWSEVRPEIRDLFLILASRAMNLMSAQ
jgi:hypothetical protein